MKTSWFTFGQTHTHSHCGLTLDKDIVVKITAEDPRDRMFELFGSQWGHEYDKQPDMLYYPRGIAEL